MTEKQEKKKKKKKTTMAFPREANTEAERDAAEKRARVAAAVSKQEWLDRTEVKFGVSSAFSWGIGNIRENNTHTPRGLLHIYLFVFCEG